MTLNGEFDREISFEITEKIGVISSYSTGWSKELNLVSWNGGTPKYDIRDWSPDHAHMSRGVTLHEKEMRLVIELLRNRGRRQAHERRGNGNIGTGGNESDLPRPAAAAQSPQEPDVGMAAASEIEETQELPETSETPDASAYLSVDAEPDNQVELAEAEA